MAIKIARGKTKIRRNFCGLLGRCAGSGFWDFSASSKSLQGPILRSRTGVIGIWPFWLKSIGWASSKRNGRNASSASGYRRFDFWWRRIFPIFCYCSFFRPVSNAFHQLIAFFPLNFFFPLWLAVATVSLARKSRRFPVRFSASFDPAFSCRLLFSWLLTPPETSFCMNFRFFHLEPVDNEKKDSLVIIKPKRKKSRLAKFRADAN